jgi:mono/diheme cytochrome c family protein
MKMGYIFLAFVLAVIVVVSMAGFRGHKFTKPPFEIFPDMNYQEKVKDQVPSPFFADGMGARVPIPGTVPEEMPAQNDYWATGKWDETHWGDGIPVHDAKDGGRPLQIDAENMARGRERYTISCEVCHGGVGDGKGITSQYGLNGVASYQTDRLRKASAGDIFNTITNGKGQMLGYGYNIAIDDRWRIIMYIRSLQLSQNAAYGDASTDEQAALDKSKKPAPPPAPAQPPAPAAGGQPQPGQAPAAPTAPSPAQPGQPTGPTAPAPAGTPAPTKPPGAAMNGTTTSPLVVYLTQQSMTSWPVDYQGEF